MKRIAVILSIATLALTAGAETNDPQALVQLGRDAIVHGDFEKAAEYLEKAVALKPNNAEYHYQLATAYGQATTGAGIFKAMSLGKKAKEGFDRAVELDPNFLPARFKLVEFYVMAPSMAGGSEAAAIEQATEIRKRNALEGHRAFARIYVAAKKTDLARKEFVDMVKEQPTSARAHYLYGAYLTLTEKNYKAANEEFEAAVKLDPSYMPAYFFIGRTAILAENNFVRGEETLKKYLTYRPKDDEPTVSRAHFFLGGLYEKQGKKAAAKSSYAASLKIKRNQKDVEEALKRVS